MYTRIHVYVCTSTFIHTLSKTKHTETHTQKETLHKIDPDTLSLSLSLSAFLPVHLSLSLFFLSRAISLALSISYTHTHTHTHTHLHPMRLFTKSISHVAVKFLVHEIFNLPGTSCSLDRMRWVADECVLHKKKIHKYVHIYIYMYTKSHVRYTVARFIRCDASRMTVCCIKRKYTNVYMYKHIVYTYVHIYIFLISRALYSCSLLRMR